MTTIAKTPMEYAGAALGIAGVAVRAASKVWELSRDWRDAPDDLHRLKDELERASHFFSLIREGHNTSPNTMPTAFRLPEIDLLLRRGSDILNEFEEFLDELKGPDKEGKRQSLAKRRRLTWMRNSRRLGQWRCDLRDIIASTWQVLIVQNAAITATLPLSIMQSRDNFVHDQITHTHASGLPTVSQLEAIVLASQRAIVAHVDHRLGFLPAPNTTSFSSEGDTKGGQGDVGNELSRALQSKKPPMCAANCRCRCHTARRMRWRMSSLDTLIGSVAIEWDRSSGSTCSPGYAACQGDGPWVNAHLKYRLPYWLARATLSILYSSNINGAPELVIRVVNHLPRSVAHSDGLIGSIARADVQGLKQRLSQRFSVFDLTGEDLVSPLLFATYMNNFPAIQVLLAAGADPRQIEGPRSERSVFDYIAYLYIRGDAEDKELIDQFAGTGIVDDLDLPLLHRCVMGNGPISLAEALSLPQCISDLDYRSSGRLSPLDIAAIRDDAEACKLLVQAGADVNASDPLFPDYHKPGKNGHFRAAEALITLGVTVAHRPIRECGAMAMATGSLASADIRILQLLIDHGHDLNKTLAGTATSLVHLACCPMEGAEERAAFLIDHGADIEGRESDGATALLYSIDNNLAALAEVFLQRGANVRAVNNQGRGVLHFAALHPTEDLLSGLLRLSGYFQGLDTNARDGGGKTPRQLFYGGQAKPGPELQAAFERFMEAVEGKWVVDIDNDWESEGEDEKMFVDAKEKFEGAEW